MNNPFGPSYFTEDDLRDAGFNSLGKNVRIAKSNKIIGLHNIEIGDNVRIDDYCTLIAIGAERLRIGSFVHIGGYCLLSAADGIIMEDFSGLSQGVRIYSRTDDYTGKYMTNPMVPAEFTGVTSGLVTLGRHVIIGAGSVILPRVSIGEGSSVGALSLVTKPLEEWGVYAGAPAKWLKGRSKDLLQLESQLLQRMQKSGT